jgi:OOP family OmpA-OmpF porin
MTSFMGKSLLVLVIATLAHSYEAFSQDTNYIKGPALGIHFLFNDFKSPAVIRATSLSSALANKTLAKFKDMSPGISISYRQGISTHFDFAGTLSGSFTEYEVDGKSLGKESLLLEGDASINGKMFTDQFWVVPFLSIGAGFSKFKGYYGAFIPAGAGLQVNFFKDAFFIINAQYRVKVSESVSNHLFASFGIVGNIGRSRQNAE